MADKTYTVVLKNETGGGASSQKAVAGSKGGDTPSETTAGKELVKGLVAYNKYVKPFVKQAVQHRIDTVELRTGSAELQQRISFGYQMASTVVGIAENIAVGAAIGNIPGAIVGAVLGIATWGMGIANRQDTINLQRINEDASLRLVNVRAGGAISTYSKSRESRQ